MPRPPVEKTDEQDVVTGWRHYLIWRPGEVSRIKRRIRRRERRLAKDDLLRQIRL